MHLLMLQLVMRSTRLLRCCVIRKLVHVLQASAPLYNLGMFIDHSSSPGPSLSPLLEIPVLLVSFIACLLDERWLE